MKPTPVYKTKLQLLRLAGNKCKKTFTDRQQAQIKQKIELLNTYTGLIDDNCATSSVESSLHIYKTKRELVSKDD